MDNPVSQGAASSASTSPAPRPRWRLAPATPWGRCVCGVTADVRSRRRAWHWRAPPGAAGPAPRPSRSGAGGASGRAGSNQTWSEASIPARPVWGPVEPVWAQSLPMRQGMRGERGQSRNRGPTAQAHRAAQGPPRRLRGPRPPPHSVRRGGGGGRRVRKPGLEGREAAGADCSPQKPPRSRGFSQRPGSGSAGPAPARPGLGGHPALASGPGRGEGSGTGRGLEMGQEGPGEAAAQAGPRALPGGGCLSFPAFRARAPRCPSLGHLLTCSSHTRVVGDTGRAGARLRHQRAKLGLWAQNAFQPPAHVGPFIRDADRAGLCCPAGAGLKSIARALWPVTEQSSCG